MLRRAVGWQITGRLHLPRTWTLAVPVVFAAAGLLATTSAKLAHGTDIRSEGRRSTAELIVDQQRRAETEQAEVNELRGVVADLNRQTAPAGSRLAGYNRELAKVAPIAGLTPVSGPALRVELDDGPKQALPASITADELIVHQQDIQAVVNALWAGGAEAMILMDQRVISTSAVHCVGNVLILQGRVYSPPYRITALGNVEAMQDSLDRSAPVAIYRQYVDRLGLGYKVTKVASETFPGFKDAVSLQHARVIRTAG